MTEPKNFYKRALGYKEPGQRFLLPFEKLPLLESKLAKLQEIIQAESRELEACNDADRRRIILQVLSKLAQDKALLKMQVHDLRESMSSNE